MDIVDIALRFGAFGVALAALGWNLLQYRLGARKAEVDAMNKRIDTVANGANKRIDAVAQELDEHKEAGQTSRAELSQRLGSVETRLQHLPDKDSVHQLNIAVTEIRGKIDTQGEALRSVSATASRVEQFLLEGSRR
jgi:hypothetical protein